MSWLFRLFFLLIAGAVLLLVFLISLLGLALSMVRWLFTGQKPQIAVVFQTYRQWQQQAAQQMRQSRRPEDVIEAEVREVPTSQPQPPQIDDKR